MENLKEFIIEKLEEASGLEGITEANALFEEEILDSMSILYLVSEIETEYGILIPLEEVIEDNFSSVNNIVLYLQGKIG